MYQHRGTHAVRAITAVVVVAIATLTSVSVAGSAQSDPLAVSSLLVGHTMNGAAISCDIQGNGVRVCHGFSTASGGDSRFKTFDGTPLEVFVTLPTDTSNPRPLIVQSHGWGAPPSGPNDTQYGGPSALQWAAQGYVVVQLAARGWGDSCGTQASRDVNPAACAKGYIRLADVRYEVRDIQTIVGLLVDEGFVDPAKIGAMGESYGGGTTLELATLKNRVMGIDGSLSPWVSPDGTPLQVTAAIPLYAWSDLATALAPNGRTFDNKVTPPQDDFTPPGVWKQSIGMGLHLLGQISGYYAPTGTDPSADIDAWFASLAKGNPSATPEINDVIKQVTQFHSPYHLLAGTYGVAAVKPPPMLFVQGFTDEVFPVDETLRYVNEERSQFPDANISMEFLDGGHQRGQNKPADATRVAKHIEAFFGYYLGESGQAPQSGVTASTQTCPETAPPGGPFHASTWAALHPGTVKYHDATTMTVDSGAGDQAVAKALDPVFGGHACTTVPATDQGNGVATYRMQTVQDSGYTLLGAPTVTVTIDAYGTNAYLAARLFDIDPATNKAVLVTRGVYRVDPKQPRGTVSFQLEPNGWRFAAGHIPKLELLGQDATFLGASPVPFSVKVSNMSLAIPIHETSYSPDVPTTSQAASPVVANPTFTG